MAVEKLFFKCHLLHYFCLLVFCSRCDYLLKSTYVHSSFHGSTDMVKGGSRFMMMEKYGAQMPINLKPISSPAMLLLK